MKIAFVVPFAYEIFFHDVEELWNYSDDIEEGYLSKRYTFHINWCRALQIAGMEVTFYHLSYSGKAVKTYFHDCGIKMKRIPTNFRKGMKGISFRLLKELSSDKPDVVYSVAHSLPPVFDMCDLLTIYCHRNGLPLITRNPGADTYNSIFYSYKIYKKRIQNIEKSESKKIVKYVYFSMKAIFTFIKSYSKFKIKQHSLKRNSIIIPHTMEDYNHLLSRFDVDEKRLTFLPKPVDFEIFREIPKDVAAEKTGLDGNLKYILHVSNLYNTKGSEHVINIMPKLLEKFPEIRFIIIGGGPKKKVLEELAENKRISEYIVFAGQVNHSDLVYYYNIADVFVLPTEVFFDEGQPNVILEAIACNTPPISTLIPGPASIIIQDKLGLLVPLCNNKVDINILQLSITKVLDGTFKIDPEERSIFIKKHSFINIGKELKTVIRNKLL